ncbi:Cobalamin synthase [Fimbriiglobus ruber]|uniref:Adenosylcobinamide-GDP ribazoletransferase n=2 Tax=Fimbriiglobus ruber TaxID=1908690 RepID=A0A225DIK2_9BACT|nr:Cobalamin synthase [Fimbriiglobus ruber]
MHAFLAAVQFLTRVPVPGGMNRPDADRSLLRAAVVFFPLVGGMIGATTGGLIWIAAHVWPPTVAVVLGLAFEAILTGAFHEDAVADCCDGFGGGWTRADVLRIMTDSRVGAFGSLGLALAVLLRIAGLTAIDLPTMVAVSAAAGALGRWAGVFVMSVVPPLPDHTGLSKDVGARVGPRHVAAAASLTMLAAAWYAAIDPVRFAAAVGCVVMASLVWAYYVRRRLGGITGDCAGFACYLGQLLVLLVAAAHPLSAWVGS